jgi:hypothetical protein
MNVIVKEGKLKYVYAKSDSNHMNIFGSFTLNQSMFPKEDTFFDCTRELNFVMNISLKEHLLLETKFQQDEEDVVDLVLHSIEIVPHKSNTVLVRIEGPPYDLLFRQFWVLLEISFPNEDTASLLKK